MQIIWPHFIPTDSGALGTQPGSLCCNKPPGWHTLLFENRGPAFHHSSSCIMEPMYYVTCLLTTWVLCSEMIRDHKKSIRQLNKTSQDSWGRFSLLNLNCKTRLSGKHEHVMCKERGESPYHHQEILFIGTYNSFILGCNFSLHNQIWLEV